MSVILDALKRVQDENRRRGAGSEPRESATPEPSSNALLRRLSRPRENAPAAGPAATGRKVSPVVWISAAGIVFVLLTAGALAWFQPTFEGPAANDGQPLLARRDGPGTREVASGGGAVLETFGGASQPAGSEGGASGMAGLEERQGEQAGSDDLFSDLSAGLPAADETAAAAVTTNAPATENQATDAMLRLEVEENPRAAARPAAATAEPRDSFVDIRSASPGESASNGARQQEWRPPTAGNSTAEPAPRGAASVPSPLVDPGVRAAFAEGVRLHKGGDLDGAAEAYTRALKSDPDNARVNANLGVLYEAQGKLTLAERHLRVAVQTEPDNAAAHNNLGVVLYRQGKYDAALIEFNRTLQLDPRHLDAYTNKGLIFTRWGQVEDAERAFQQVLAIDPTNALAHYNLGLVYEEQGRFGQAVEEYYRFLELGGMAHPEITSYLDRHLQWLERRVDAGGR